MKKITIGSEGRGSWGLYWVIKSIREKFKDCEIIIPPYVTQWSPDLITGQFENITVKENSKDCDFIIKSNFLHDEAEWNTSSKKYIYWSGESYGPQKSEYQSDFINLFTSDPEDEKTAYMPFFMYSPFLNRDKIERKHERNKLVAYCHNNMVKIREDIFNLFVEKSKNNSCTSYGNCYGKYPETNNKIHAFWFHENLIKHYALHNFVMAMENKIYDGYVTEKILNAYSSGSIPIYWGDSQYVKLIFNKKSFINVSDFENIEECANYITSITESEINTIINEPVFNLIEGIDARIFLYKKCSEKINNFLFN